MRNLTPEFSADLAALLEKYNVDKIDVPRILGKGIYKLGPDISNSAKWVKEGLFSQYIKENGVFEALVSLYKEMEKRGYTDSKYYNYNDYDCDLWANRSEINGVSIYTFLHNNHGNAKVYVLKEDSGFATQLHVRVLKYNLSRKTLYSLFKKFVAAAKCNRYDSDFEYFKYLDLRDDGFVFSGSFYSIAQLPESCEVGENAAFCISTIVEHFPYIFEDEDVI